MSKHKGHATHVHSHKNIRRHSLMNASTHVHAGTDMDTGAQGQTYAHMHAGTDMCTRARRDRHVHTCTQGRTCAQSHGNGLSGSPCGARVLMVMEEPRWLSLG